MKVSWILYSAVSVSILVTMVNKVVADGLGPKCSSVGCECANVTDCVAASELLGLLPSAKLIPCCFAASTQKDNYIISSPFPRSHHDKYGVAAGGEDGKRVGALQCCCVKPETPGSIACTSVNSCPTKINTDGKCL